MASFFRLKTWIFDNSGLIFASGISLTEEQWSVFKKNVPAIEKAIKNMQSQIM